MELIPCRVVESSCLPTHNIVPHISWHDLPCHRMWLPKLHKNRHDVDFEPSRSPEKSESWNTPALHWCACVTHMTLLPKFTRVMNVRDQTCQTSVTCFGPFRYRTSRFVHWPQNIRSTNTCQISACQNNLRTCFWQFSHGFQFFFFGKMVVQARTWNFVELLSRLVGQLTISFQTFLGMTFHIVGPRRDSVCLKFPWCFSIW